MANFCKSFFEKWKKIGQDQRSRGLDRCVALRIAPLPGSRLIAAKVGKIRRVVAASPQDLKNRPIPVHLMTPEGRLESAKVRAFVDFAAARLRR
jgi:DNA-binding transcriptional LysR family regulator